MLEIGVGGYSNPNAGESLRMQGDWSAHPGFRLIGVDLFAKTLSFDDPRIKVLQGSQIDPQLLNQPCEEGGPFHIIVDDGSHIPEHAITTFRRLYPRLAAPGVYIVKDTRTSYWQDFGKDSFSAAQIQRNPRDPINSYSGQLITAINHAEVPGEQASSAL